MLNIENVPQGTFIGNTDELKKLATAEVANATAIRIDRVTQGYGMGQWLVSAHAHRNRKWQPTAFWTRSLQVPTIPEKRWPFLQASFDNHTARCIGEQIPRTYSNFGGDPEIFVEDANGHIIPATDFLPSKHKPLYAESNEANVYWDGFQAEIAIDPATCLAWTADRIHDGLQLILKSARNKFPGARLSAKTVIALTPEQLNQGTPDQVALGCKPSFNAYDLPPLDQTQAKLIPFRCGGAHVHASPDQWKAQPLPVYIAGCKAIDRTIGVMSVSLLAGLEDPVRREFYGKPGEFRTPPHGFEYRVFSNAIIFHPATMHLVYDMFRTCMRFHLAKLDRYWKADEQEVIETIKNIDIKQAKKIVDRNKQVIESMAASTFQYAGNERIWNSGATTLKVIREGIVNFMTTPTDVEANWLLHGRWTRHSEGRNCQWGKALRTIASGRKI